MNEIFNVLNKFGKPYIVGSEAIFKALGINMETRDTDVLLDSDTDINIIKKELLKIGSSFVATNSLGGIKMIYNNRTYDIWKVSDTSIYLEGYERNYNNAEDVIKSFGYNLYQVGIRPDGEYFCTDEFLKYATTKELKLINTNIKNLERLTLKALENNNKISRILKR